MDLDDPRNPLHPKGCTRACCVVQRRPDSDEEDEEEPPLPPAKQQRTTVPAAAASSVAVVKSLPPGDTSRCEVLLGDRIMTGQRVQLTGLTAQPHLNGTMGRTVAFEAASGCFRVEVGAGASCESIKPENLQPAAPKPIPQRPDKPEPGIDFSSGRSSREEQNEMTFALALPWEPESDDLRGFVAMEKYDGIRAMWEPPKLGGGGSGGGFRTRGGALDKPLKRFPPSIEALLPTDMRLDGEIWSRRGDFEGANCFKLSFHSNFAGSPADIEKRWEGLSFKVYDAPSLRATFLERLAAARTALPADSPRVHVVQATRCEDASTARTLLTRIESFGGEGLILRRASGGYHAGRDKKERSLLKVKTQYDSEARLVARVNGRDSWWASTVENGSLFKISSGGNRGQTLAIGDVVTYAYMGLVHADGGPRFPSIKHVHTDCECAACALQLGAAWPISASWRVADNKKKLVRLQGGAELHS